MAVQWAADLAFDLWQLAQPMVASTVPQMTPCWVRPATGWLKCNVDGAFYENQWHGATGSVIRDDCGNFLSGSAMWYANGLDALTMDALACRDGIVLAQQNGVQRLWLETDCLELVNLWVAGNNQRSSVMSILSEIRDRRNLFQEFRFTFISRTCNKVAHVLAKQVTDNVQARWWRQAPACIFDLLSSDCNPGSIQ